MKRYILTIITSCLLFVNFSCNDFLEEKVVSKATMAYYEIPEGIDAVVNSIYSKMRWPFSGERFHNYALLRQWFPVRSWERLGNRGKDFWTIKE